VGEHGLSRTIFIVGAGASAEMGYPLTRDLLFGLEPRLNSKLRNQFGRVVRFHCPMWDGRRETLPNIEEFLTQLVANEDLLPVIRPTGPHFGLEELRQFREDILLEIARWFHEIHHAKRDPSPIRDQLLQRIKDCENPVIMSFNWDYELDKAVFGKGPDLADRLQIGYGAKTVASPGIVILKPHGSLNWYLQKVGQHIKSDRVTLLWEPSDRNEKQFESIFCFLRWRGPKSSHGRRYVPWIVPPTHMKSFQHPMLRGVWRRCAHSLGTASKVFFLGYSLPAADWHARYIFRCGFYNDPEVPPRAGVRAKRAGSPEITVVNPDNGAFRRTEAVVGKNCNWIPLTVARWLAGGK